MIVSLISVNNVLNIFNSFYPRLQFTLKIGGSIEFFRCIHFLNNNIIGNYMIITDIINSLFWVNTLILYLNTFYAKKE